MLESAGNNIPNHIDEIKRKYCCPSEMIQQGRKVITSNNHIQGTRAVDPNLKIHLIPSVPYARKCWKQLSAFH